MALAEIAVDLRQLVPGTLRESLAAALRDAGADDALSAGAAAPLYLDGWSPLRDSVIWRFNRLFWQRADWEAATGRGFEEALPSGRSDASHPEAVADSVADFWTLLRDLDKKGALPPEVFALEIGVARPCGSIASGRSTRSGAPPIIPGFASSWATTPCPRSTGRWRRSGPTGNW